MIFTEPTRGFARLLSGVGVGSVVLRLWLPTVLLGPLLAIASVKYAESKLGLGRGDLAYLGLCILSVLAAALGVVVANSLNERERTFRQCTRRLVRSSRTAAQRQLEETDSALKRSNTSLEQFTRVACHDLKSPLRAIQNLCAWLQEDLAEIADEKSKKHLRMLGLRAQRMESLLTDLREYARLGQVEQAAETIDLEKLLTEIFDSYAHESKMNLRLELYVKHIDSPKAPLSLVFRNLIGNAIKHHDTGQGVIQISSRQIAEGVIRFQVSDDGPGIDPRYHDKIFEPFQRLFGSNSDLESGMGLSFVKRATEEMGGVISVRSEPGAGATFDFTWPGVET